MTEVAPVDIQGEGLDLLVEGPEMVVTLILVGIGNRDIKGIGNAGPGVRNGDFLYAAALAGGD